MKNFKTGLTLLFTVISMSLFSQTFYNGRINGQGDGVVTNFEVADAGDSLELTITTSIGGVFPVRIPKGAALGVDLDSIKNVIFQDSTIQLVNINDDTLSASIPFTQILNDLNIFAACPTGQVRIGLNCVDTAVFNKKIIVTDNLTLDSTISIDDGQGTIVTLDFKNYFNTVDTDSQSLNLTGLVLEITRGNTVDFAPAVAELVGDSLVNYVTVTALGDSLANYVNRQELLDSLANINFDFDTALVNQIVSDSLLAHKVVVTNNMNLDSTILIDNGFGDVVTIDLKPHLTTTKIGFAADVGTQFIAGNGDQVAFTSTQNIITTEMLGNVVNIKLIDGSVQNQVIKWNNTTNQWTLDTLSSQEIVYNTNIVGIETVRLALDSLFNEQYFFETMGISFASSTGYSGAKAVLNKSNQEIANLKFKSLSTVLGIDENTDSIIYDVDSYDYARINLTSSHVNYSRPDATRDHDKVIEIDATSFSPEPQFRYSVGNLRKESRHFLKFNVPTNRNISVRTQTDNSGATFFPISVDGNLVDSIILTNTENMYLEMYWDGSQMVYLHSSNDNIGETVEDYVFGFGAYSVNGVDTNHLYFTWGRDEFSGFVDGVGVGAPNGILDTLIVEIGISEEELMQHSASSITMENDSVNICAEELGTIAVVDMKGAGNERSNFFFDGATIASEYAGKQAVARSITGLGSNTSNTTNPLLLPVTEKRYLRAKVTFHNSATLTPTELDTAAVIAQGLSTNVHPIYPDSQFVWMILDAPVAFVQTSAGASDDSRIFVEYADIITPAKVNMNDAVLKLNNTPELTSEPSYYLAKDENGIVSQFPVQNVQIEDVFDIECDEYHIEGAIPDFETTDANDDFEDFDLSTLIDAPELGLFVANEKDELGIRSGNIITLPAGEWHINYYVEHPSYDWGGSNSQADLGVFHAKIKLGTNIINGVNGDANVVAASIINRKLILSVPTTLELGITADANLGSPDLEDFAISFTAQKKCVIVEDCNLVSKQDSIVGDTTWQFVINGKCEYDTVISVQNIPPSLQEIVGDSLCHLDELGQKIVGTCVALSNITSSTFRNVNSIQSKQVIEGADTCTIISYYDTNGQLYHRDSICSIWHVQSSESKPLIADFSGRYDNLTTYFDDVRINGIPITQFQKVVNGTVTGNDLALTSTGSNWGTSGASSVTELRGDGHLSFKVKNNATVGMGGLSYKEADDPDQHYNSVDYQWHISVNQIYVYERATARTANFPVSVGDSLTVSVKDRIVYYSQNSDTMYISTVPIQINTVKKEIREIAREVQFLPERMNQIETQFSQILNSELDTSYEINNSPAYFLSLDTENNVTKSAPNTSTTIAQNYIHSLFAPADTTLLWGDIPSTNSMGVRDVKRYSFGEWNHVEWYSVPTKVYVDEVEYNLTTGQSNATPYTEGGDNSLTPYSLLYNNVSGQSEILDPNASAASPAGCTDCNWVFLQYAKQAAKNKRKLTVFVHYAIGGLDIENWTQGTKPMYTELVNRANAASNNGQDFQFDNFIIIQGEANNGDDLAYYETQFIDSLVNGQLRNEPFINNETRFFAVELPGVVANTSINQFFRSLDGGRYPNVYFIPTSDIGNKTRVDGSHTNSEGVSRIGKRIYQHVNNKVGNLNYDKYLGSILFTTIADGATVNIATDLKKRNVLLGDITFSGNTEYSTEFEFTCRNATGCTITSPSLSISETSTTSSNSIPLIDGETIRLAYDRPSITFYKF